MLTAHSEGRSPRQAVRGAPSGPGGPRARSAGVSRPGAASGPARSAAAAPRSRCPGSLLSATWVPPSHRLCARGQRGSASRPECKWGLPEGATGWWSPTSGHVSLRHTNPQLFAPKSGVLQSTPSPTAGGTSQHCRLDKALSLWAGNGAQSRHHIGKHFLFMSGSLWGESQGQQPARKPAGAWNRVQGDGGGAGLRPGTTGMAEVHWPSTWQDICF